MATRQRILVLTRHTPLPWEDGAGAYLHDILCFLHSRGFEIHVGWLAPHDHLRWQGVWTLPADFARVVHLHAPGAGRIGRRLVFPAIYWQPFVARTLNLIKRTLAAVGIRVGRQPATTHRAPPPGPRPPPPGWMATPSPAEHAYAAALLLRIRPSVVVANYAWLTPLFAAATAGLSFHRVCLLHDVAWRRSARLAALSSRPPEITAEAESALLRAATTIVAISAADARDQRELAPAAEMIVAPKSVRPLPLPPAREPRLLFVGSANSFNAAGLAWFLAEVWPLIHASRPEAELDVCGSVATTATLRPAGVHLHGPVPELDTFYRAAALVVVPLLHATGLNIKLVDAAARGRAIITTSVTLEGAPFLKGSVAVADNPADFARTSLELLADFAKRAEFADRSLSVVRDHLSPEACYAQLAAALQ